MRRRPKIKSISNSYQFHSKSSLAMSCLPLSGIQKCPSRPDLFQRHFYHDDHHHVCWRLSLMILCSFLITFLHDFTFMNQDFYLKSFSTRETAVTIWTFSGWEKVYLVDRQQDVRASIRNSTNFLEAETILRENIRSSWPDRCRWPTPSYCSSLESSVVFVRATSRPLHFASHRQTLLQLLQHCRGFCPPIAVLLTSYLSSTCHHRCLYRHVCCRR